MIIKCGKAEDTLASLPTCDTRFAEEFLKEMRIQANFEKSLIDSTIAKYEYIENSTTSTPEDPYYVDLSFADYPVEYWNFEVRVRSQAR